MKKLKTTVTVTVPHWNFCNCDRLAMWGDLTGATCKFCVVVNGQPHCALFDKELTTINCLVEKTEACCRMTAGFKSEIISDNVQFDTSPRVEPKVIMSETIREYEKAVKQLMNQGLPYNMAAKVAKQSLLGR